MDKIQAHLSELTKNAMKTLKEEPIRNMDKSRLTTDHTLRMLQGIFRCGVELNLLLELTEEAGGFGSAYPKKCLDSLGLFRLILEAELRGDL